MVLLRTSKAIFLILKPFLNTFHQKINFIQVKNFSQKISRVRMRVRQKMYESESESESGQKFASPPSPSLSPSPHPWLHEHMIYILH